MKRLMAGIDLHSNNVVIGIIDQDGQRVAHQKLECDLKKIVKFLAPYKKQLEKLAVESTCNWYWLVDGLQARGHPVVLANPAKIVQYSGLKHADDKSDAFFLAELLRLGILPTGYMYDCALRPVRDLLRRRMGLVHQESVHADHRRGDDLAESQDYGSSGGEGTVRASGQPAHCRAAGRARRGVDPEHQEN
jgi:transposase